MTELNWTSFFIGLAIVAAGAAMVGFYRQISHGIAGGPSSYEKVKLWGVIVCVIGFVVMFNIHTAILHLIFEPIFGK
ncbi:MAG: hypothetical protein ACOX0Z_01915 [Candidatus Nanosyncoccaceae bacterium]|jgi:phosphatidylserine synthase